MALYDWRKLTFFDLLPNIDFGKVSETLQNAEVTCGLSGRDQYIICDSWGRIHVFYSDWSNVSFKGHDNSISYCVLSMQKNLLVTMSCPNTVGIPFLKIWNLSKLSKTKGAPCISSLKSTFQLPTALGVSENGHYLAVGYIKGSISLYMGDIEVDRAKTLKELSIGRTTVVGIKFKQQDKKTYMFVCSDFEVILYLLHFKTTEKKIILDSANVPVRCCALQSYIGMNDPNFMVGRDDAIYCYTTDGRGPCYALEGQKVLVEWYRAHLLIITKTKSTSCQKEHRLTIIDIQNKFIVYTSPIDTIVGIFIDFGTCLILTKKKDIFQLNEKNLQMKLMLLFQKNMYDIAISIAINQQYNAEGIAFICKHYADYLYGKGNFNAAAEQYIKTIKYLEPSYVIRKFLDTRHITILTSYLQALHSRGEATAHHTNLLMNCLARLELPTHITDFISSHVMPNMFINTDAIVRIARITSIDTVIKIAKLNQKHEVILNMLLEDSKKFDEALEYASTLTVADFNFILKSYGNLIMYYRPDRMAELAKHIYANINSSKTSEQYPLLKSYIQYKESNIKNFIQLFVKHPKCLINFLESIVESNKNSERIIYNTLLELYLQRWKYCNYTLERLLEILKTFSACFNKQHVLVQLRLYNFMPGVINRFEEEKWYHLILHHEVQNNNFSKALDYCKKFGSSQPSLWKQSLNRLRSNSTSSPNILLDVLHSIVSENLLSPLQTLNCLAIQEGPILSSVREYFVKIFQKQLKYILLEEKNAEDIRKNLQLLNSRLVILRTELIEIRSSLCDSCHQVMNMPAVYFFCQHSFHQDCIRSYSENEKECGVCHARNSQLYLAMIAQDESQGQHETFHNLMDRSCDAFSVVSQYFSRGFFNKIVIVDEHEPLQVNKSIQVESQNSLKYADSTKYKTYNRNSDLKVDRFKKNIENQDCKANLSRDVLILLNNPHSTQQNISHSLSSNSRTIASNGNSKNPFENSDIYDESKNPFASEACENVLKCDNNFNPFE